MARLASDSLSSQARDYERSTTRVYRTHQLSALTAELFALLGRGVTSEALHTRLSAATDNELSVLKNDLNLFKTHVLAATDTDERQVIGVVQEIADAVIHGRTPVARLAQSVLKKLQGGVTRDALTQLFLQAEMEALAKLPAELTALAARLPSDAKGTAATDTKALFAEVAKLAQDTLEARRATVARDKAAAAAAPIRDAFPVGWFKRVFGGGR